MKALALYKVQLQIDDPEETQKQICVNDLATIKELLTSFPDMKTGIENLPLCQDATQQRINQLYVQFAFLSISSLSLTHIVKDYTLRTPLYYFAKYTSMGLICGRLIIHGLQHGVGLETYMSCASYGTSIRFYSSQFTNFSPTHDTTNINLKSIH
jgi:hypothetical protein